MSARHLNEQFSDREFLRKEAPWEALYEFTKPNEYRSDKDQLNDRLQTYGTLRESIWDVAEHKEATLADDYLLVLQFMKEALTRELRLPVQVSDTTEQAPAPLEKIDVLV